MEAHAKSNKKPITFICQPDGITTGPNKSRINAHIATQAHQRRRNRQQKLLVTKEARLTSNRASHLTSWNKSRLQNTPWSAVHFLDSYGDVQVSTRSILQNGNSDPFAATPIRVNSEVSRLLTFTRDCVLPSLHGVEASFAEGPMLMNMWWQDVLDGLQGGSAGYAYLSRSAAIMATITGSSQTRHTALTFRDQASAALRTELMDVRASSTKMLCWSIFALFSAEIASHDFSAAQVHGQMLRKFLQPQTGEALGKVEMEKRFLMAVLLQDITRATLSLSRPSFDLDRWKIENLPGTILDDTYTQGPSLFPMERELDPSLSLRVSLVFAGIREWLLVLGMLIMNPKVYTQKLLINGAMRLLILEGHLIINYLDAMECLQTDSEVQTDDMVRIELLEEACISLAAVYWLRRVAHERMGAGSKLSQAGSNAHDTGPITLKVLEITYRDLESFNSKRILPTLHLWILYVGAVAEQANKKINPTCQYFNKHFVVMAQKMGLTAWDNVVIVLKPFLYLDTFGPMARHWFARMMQTATRSGTETLKQEEKFSSDWVHEIVNKIDRRIS